MELAPGVRSLSLSIEYGETEMTLRPVLVETGRGPLLVDVGLPGTIDALAAELADTGRALDDVRTVVLTHHDGDHAGALRDLLGRTDAITVAHREEAPFVVGDREPLKAAGDRYPPAPIDVEIVGGVVFDTRAGPMQAVETPGHSPGHVSLYFPDEELLIAGDALIVEDELQGPNPDFTPERGRAVRSLAGLSDLSIERTHCYHGGFVEAGAERIEAIRQDLERS